MTNSEGEAQCLDIKKAWYHEAKQSNGRIAKYHVKYQEQESI